MHEMLYIAAGNRLPIVMPMVNRTLSAPLNIHGDHSDSMGSRDAAWIQYYCMDAQEIYDATIMAIRIAEHKDVSLPVMVCFDGFNVSHDMERVEMLDAAEVRSSSARTILRSICSILRTRSASAPWCCLSSSPSTRSI